MNEIANHEKNIYDVTIIGAGASGIFAATVASFFKLSNIVLEKKAYLGGQPIELYPNKFIYDFPCFPEIKSSEVIKKLVDQNKKLNRSTILLETEIIDVKKVSQENQSLFLFTTSKKTFYSKNIVIATGNGAFNPKKLEINNQIINSEDIHYSVDLNTVIYKDKKIIILGGGDSAVEWANYFVEEKITDNVTIIHRRNEYRSSSFMVDCLIKNKVVQKLNYEITNLDEKNKKLTIKHKENQLIENLFFDYLIVQYGQTPNPMNIEIFNQIKKDKGKFIIDLNQKTNYQNIYAVGDATYFECKPNTLITACADATRAIWHIVKNKEP